MSIEVLKQIWPEWNIEGKPLGKGSFGVVYKAVRRDYGVESYAAIKVISIPSDPSEIDSLRSEGLNLNATRTYLQGVVNDFVSEIQLMESLKGVQNIVSVEDYKVVEKTEEIGWNIYIRMELLTSFNAYICDKKLTEEEVIKLGSDICTALEICAKRNVIHRDIKPENIFINDFGDFKLGDFGIARKMENLTGGLSQKGAVNYMAPEVANSSEYDARVDIYSLGIVLYRLMNDNRLPFLDSKKQILNPNERRNAVDRRLRGEELPAPCNASPAMADLILRACAYDPDMRFASAADMKRALICVANGTYQVCTSNLDRTTSVHKVPGSYDKTTSVRKAPDTTNQRTSSAVSTFGSTPKKKSKMPAAIAAVLAVVFLVGVGIFAVPKLFDGNDTTDPSETSGTNTSETAGYSKLDEEQIASIISEADALAAEEDYEGALSKVQAGLATYPKSKELTAKSKEYEDLYVADVITQADVLASTQEFDEAQKLLRQSSKNVENKKDLIDKLNEIDNMRPVSLSTLHIIDSSGFKKKDGIFVDSFGNSYDGAFYFEYVGYDEKYAIFNMNNECTTFSGSIVACQETGSNEQMLVQIYVDDVLRYTSSEFSKTSGKIDFEIDVSGGQQLKIKAGLASGYWGDATFAIVNGRITKDPESVKKNTENKQTSVHDVNSTGLDKLFLIDSSGFKKKDGAFVDSFGNSYDGAFYFEYVGYDEEYAIFNLNNKYSVFSGSIVTCQETGSNEQMLVQIYIDDVLKYTSSEFGKTSGKIDFEIDVSGGQQLKIKAGLVSGYWGDATFAIVNGRVI